MQMQMQMQMQTRAILTDGTEFKEAANNGALTGFLSPPLSLAPYPRCLIRVMRSAAR